MKRGCLIVLLLVHGIGVAFAHGGGAEEPGPTWTFDLWITIPLLAFALSYLSRKRWPDPNDPMLRLPV